jgi:membrane-associated phospholipid phosphatase
VRVGNRSSHTGAMQKDSGLKYLPVDKATLAYMLVLSFIILIFRGNLHNWMAPLAFNLGVCAIIVILVNGLNGHTNRWAMFFRHWYPLLFFILLYEETRYLIHLVLPHSLDPLVNSFELTVFGAYPTVWLEKFISSGLNEYLMFSYSSYYLLLAVLGAVLYFGRKKKEFDDLLFTSAVAYYISYLCFVLLPVEGPRFALAEAYQIEMNGGFFTRLAHGLVEKAGIQGAAMPSSHVAVALVVLVYARRHHRTLYYVLFPLVASLLISTVYGRFHYVSDVAAGLVVGVASILICDMLLGTRAVPATDKRVEKEFSLDLAASD